MYDPLKPYEDANEDSSDAVAWHQGSHKAYVSRCRRQIDKAVKQGPAAVKEIGHRLFEWSVAPEMLYDAWRWLKKRGGKAPGPNGRTYRDLDRTEVWSLLRAISKAARSGNYHPHKARLVSFLKDRSQPERGKRTIRILDIEDRVLQRAIHVVTQPLIEPHLGEGVFGCRPRLSRFDALAHVERVAFAEDRFVWLKEDLANAFDRIPRSRLLQVLAEHVPSDELVALIGQLVQTKSKRGVPQGGPLSPQMLNVFLMHFLDTRWKKQFPGIPQVRYVDDLLMLFKEPHEAIGAREDLKKLLQPTGMKLKGDASNSVFDLRDGRAVEWLGFEIRLGDNELDVRISERAWSRLEDSLELAHLNPDSPLQAIEMINGWIEQMGPSYPFVDRGEVYERLKSHAQEQAFDEIPSRSAIRSRWERAHERYRAIREHGSAGVQHMPIAPSETAAVFDPDSTDGDPF